MVYTTAGTVSGRLIQWFHSLSGKPQTQPASLEDEAYTHYSVPQTSEVFPAVPVSVFLFLFQTSPALWQKLRLVTTKLTQSA